MSTELKSSAIKYTKESNTYTLQERVSLQWKGHKFGYWMAYGVGKNSNKKFIEASSDVIHIYPGYSWDGCTGVPTSDWNLRASLLHDALYQAKKCGAKTLSWREIDSLFRIMMKQDEADLFHRNLYYYGVKVFGFWWKLGKLDSLKIVSSD